MINNIKNFLNKDGYILMTLFDAERVHNILSKGNYKSMYTDEDAIEVYYLILLKNMMGN